MRQSLNLSTCETPDDAVAVLRAASDKFAEDSVNMDATAFLDGRTWAAIAQEMDRAADRITRRCAKLGYPFLK